MKKSTTSNMKLGSFVLIGLGLLIATLYLIGNNQNLFDRTFRIHATFYDVNGLMPGNNVRFSGINVGTVKEIQIINDTSVSVMMIIKDDVRKFIKRTSIAAVGTDGVMGNKLININTVKSPSLPVVEGDTLQTQRAVETDRMLRTLDKTNTNLSAITSDLKEITSKVNTSKTLWSLVNDTSMMEDIKTSIKSVRSTTRNTATFASELNGIMVDMKHGKGAIGYLLTDTTGESSARRSMLQIREASTSAKSVVADLKKASEKLKQGNGPMATLLTDSIVSRDLKLSMHNIRESSVRLNQNMEAMKHNFLFRGYFRKLERKNRKDSIAKARH